MARKATKKKLTDAEIAKMRELETYEHADKSRTNIPPVGMAQYDKAEEKVKTYAFDPHLDPELQWAGKAEGTSFTVPTSSIHVHESIKPHKIIRAVQAIGDDYQPAQMELFESPVDRMRRRRDAIEFYKHGVNWTNRLIAGDSLVVMNSMLEKEGMAGQVQMMYFDPPYGIKYGSNFQPFVNQKNVKEKDEDMSQEPEMIKAFRDTWELGVHSYLSYLRNRLLLARELLSDSGSVFIQISEENVHRVRNICDEVFGAENLVAQISFRKKTMPLGASFMEQMHDYIVFYAKDKTQVKFRNLFLPYKPEGSQDWKWVELPDGTRREMSNEERCNYSLLPKGSRPYRLKHPNPIGENDANKYPFTFQGETYDPPQNGWGMEEAKLRILEKARRIQVKGNLPNYILYLDDFPVTKLTTPWIDTVGPQGKSYVVQTDETPIQRCMLMTTDPGDLVLDITCGSGTTAAVAEEWGRRWITCDTSRVSVALAKKRLMTATYDYFKLAHPEQGVGSGFVYKTVPHITLKSIANKEPPATETLYDQPIIEKNKIRITGPFTVEALPAPVVRPLDEVDAVDENLGKKQDDWRAQLKATGIMGRGGDRLGFSRVEPLTGTKFLQAEAETKEDKPRRAVVCFAGETKPLDSRMVAMALQEAEDMRPSPQLIVFAAFQFDPEAAKDIDETKWPGVTLLKAQMNTDLMTGDLKKKQSSDQSFWFVGQPDAKLVPGKKKNTYTVRVDGFDYYDVVKGEVIKGGAGRIAMWMLDEDYDGMCVEPHQVFFPMGGKKDGWAKLAKTLHAEIDQEKIAAYAGNVSLPFTAQPNSMVAVKIIDDRGIESLKVFKIGDEA